MTDALAFDDQFLPLPPKATEADPACAIRDLYYRVGRLEYALDEERARGVADWRETLLELIAIADAIQAMMERWGVTTSAQQASMIREMAGVGRQLHTILKHHGVEPVSTIGESLDVPTSDVTDRQERDNLLPNTVLREEKIGYLWPHGLLRRAEVVISVPSGTETADKPDPRK